RLLSRAWLQLAARSGGYPLRPAWRVQAGGLREGYRAADCPALRRGCGTLSRRGVSGPLTGKLPMSERLVLCNMVIDFGAKTGYIQPDETTVRFMAQRAPHLQWTAERTDSD